MGHAAVDESVKRQVEEEYNTAWCCRIDLSPFPLKAAVPSASFAEPSSMTTRQRKKKLIVPPPPPSIPAATVWIILFPSYITLFYFPISKCNAYDNPPNTHNADACAGWITYAKSESGLANNDGRSRVAKNPDLV